MSIDALLFSERKMLCNQQERYMPFIKIVAESKAYRLFAKFRNGNFDLEHSGKPLVIDHDQIEMQIKSNTGHTTQDIPEMLCISHMSIVRQLKSLSYVNCNDVYA